MQELSVKFREAHIIFEVGPRERSKRLTVNAVLAAHTCGVVEGLAELREEVLHILDTERGDGSFGTLLLGLVSRRVFEIALAKPRHSLRVLCVCGAA